MKFGKKLLSLFLSVVMLVSMLGTTALAAGGSANVEFTVDKSTAAVGDTITVVFKNKEMTVSSFTGGIFFDKNKLECTSIVGPDSEYPSDFGLTKKTGKNPWVDATAVSNVTQANNAGTVGFGYAGASDVEYAASELYTATFKVKEGATGTAVFTLYEDTAGTDTFKSDSIESKSVTIGGGTPTPPAPTTYTVSFNAGGGTGTMANGTTDTAGKYTLPACTFTAPSGKEFKAWQVNSEEKAVGAEITLTADTTVTALWKDIPHTHVKGTPVPEVPATCSSTGTKAYYPCTGCDAKLDADGNEIADLTIQKDATKHSFGAWNAEVPATCTSTGMKGYKDCSLCGKHFDNSGNEIADLTIQKLLDGQVSNFIAAVVEVLTAEGAVLVTLHTGARAGRGNFRVPSAEAVLGSVLLDGQVSNFIAVCIQLRITAGAGVVSLRTGARAGRGDFGNRRALDVRVRDVLPQRRDGRVRSQSDFCADSLLLAVDLPSLELLAAGRGEGASRQSVLARSIGRAVRHRTRAAARVEADGIGGRRRRSRRTAANGDGLALDAIGLKRIRTGGILIEGEHRRACSPFLHLKGGGIELAGRVLNIAGSRVAKSYRSGIIRLRHIGYRRGINPRVLARFFGQAKITGILRVWSNDRRAFQLVFVKKDAAGKGTDRHFLVFEYDCDRITDCGGGLINGELNIR